MLEAVIKDEIVGETDNFVERQQDGDGGPGRSGQRSDPTNFLTLFEHKIREQEKLSEAETAAITAFLSLNVSEFKARAIRWGLEKARERVHGGGHRGRRR